MSKTQPVLLPASIALLADKPCQVAPPVALLSLIVVLTALTVPVVRDSVNCVPGVELVRYTGVAAPPAMENVVAVLVDPARNLIVPWARVTVLDDVMLSEKTTVPPAALNTQGLVSVRPADTRVCVARPAMVIIAVVPVNVNAVLSLKSPPTATLPVKLNVAASVRPEASIVPANHAVSSVIVLPATSPRLSITAVSCASGKLAAAATPPDVSAHAVADQLPLRAELQYFVVPAANVTLVLPPALPRRVPDHGAEAPAIVMSRKSTSDNVATAATVSVRGVPKTLLRSDMRDVGVAAGPRVSVPVTV